MFRRLVLFLSLWTLPCAALAHDTAVETLTFLTDTWRLVCHAPADKLAVIVCPDPGPGFPAGQPWQYAVIQPTTGHTVLRVARIPDDRCLIQRSDFPRTLDPTQGVPYLLVVMHPQFSVPFRYRITTQCLDEDGDAIPHTRHRLLQDE